MRGRIAFIFALSFCSSTVMAEDICPVFVEKVAVWADNLASTHLSFRDRILYTQLARDVSRVSGSATALANRLGASPMDSTTDRYLDLLNALRERHTLMQKYVAWIHEIFRKYSGNYPRSDASLGKLAEALRPKYFEIALPKIESEPTRNFNSAKIEIKKLSAEEFKSQVEVIVDLMASVRKEFDTAFVRSRTKKEVLLKEVVEIRRQRRIAFVGMLKVLAGGNAGMNGIMAFQKLVATNLVFAFPKELQFRSSPGNQEDSDLRAELANEPLLNDAMQSFLNLTTPPTTEGYWEQLILAVTGE